MQTNKLELYSVYDLIKDKPYSFLIPSYQRGYRWTEKQVEDLLNDIEEFTFDKNKKTNEFYCLQPVVIKHKNEVWEVIDGQQRLTTIYLLLKYFNSRFAVDFQKQLFSIRYETRVGSAEYLQSLDAEKSDNNVDFFFMFQAFATIKNWFRNKQNIINDFEAALLNHTKVIWYEVNEDIDSIDIFTRLNMGKIPLTNAELIKALFLRRNNFEGDERTRELRQLEISGEWDRMEAALRNEEFWGFLTNTKETYENRIELIFDLMNYEPKEDKDSTFRYFHREINEPSKIEAVWGDVKEYFLTFQEWYHDKELFHLIGFLICLDEKSTDLEGLKAESKGITKSKFKEILKHKIRVLFAKIQVSELNYIENRLSIERTLLLFNIISIIQNLKSNYRFQFGRFKNENWDIEHIHSLKSNTPEREDHQKDWIKDTLDYLQSRGGEDDLIERINIWLKTEKKDRPEEFEIIYNDILKRYSEDESSEEINDIGNLTLLDAGTNRGYKNAFYAVKRNKIIAKDQNGTFIPLCTKNVFLKYYTHSAEQMTIWGETDRKAYIDAILKTLKEYLPEQTYTINQD